LFPALVTILADLGGVTFWAFHSVGVAYRR
jgi:hypothetical protein